MLKESISSSLTAPYDHYLADLFREIKEAGCCVVPAPRPSLIRRRYDGATEISEPITFTLEKQPVPTPPPPYPLVFSGLPVDVLPNIERAVKIYCRHIQPLRTADIQARASELYEMAYDVAEGKALALYKASVMKLPKEAREQVVAELEAKAQKNIPTIELEAFSAEIEKHLNAAVLECRGESTKGEYHLDFFLLALMRLGTLKRDIGDSVMVASHSYEIERSLNRGVSDCREQKAAKNMYELRGVEEVEKHTARHKAISALGGSKTFELSYKPAKEFVLKRYDELSLESEKTGKKLSKKEIAEHIHAELKAMPLGCPDYRVLYERWLPKKTKRKTHATS